MKLKKKFNICILIIFLTISNLFLGNTCLANTPEINSEAAILIENKTGNVLFEKNSTKKMYPASTTKIMTAILAIENCDLNEIATVSKEAVYSVPSGYTTARLVVGEEISREDLLYALMLNSANEAANVIAEHISGSVDEFAILMTEKAKELGCNNTNFKNANGMHNEDHYTTAEDLAKITKYCMKNETFKKIVSTQKYYLPSTNKYSNSDRLMTNTNILIQPNSKYYYKYAIGVKTGYTTQAGNCLVSFSNNEGVELICVTLKASSRTDESSYRFNDNKNLFEFGYNNFSNQTIIKSNTVINTITVPNATKESKNLNIITKEDINDYISNEINLEKLKPEIKINENIKAPLYAGDILGKISYEMNGKTYSTDLIAETTVYTKQNYTTYILLAGLILLIISIILVPKKIRKH